MPVLHVDSKVCHLDDKDVQFLWQLDKTLQYNVPGAQYTKAFKGYRDRNGDFVKWDGKVKLLKDDGSFPYGLKQAVIDFYKEKGHALHVQYDGKEIIPAEPRDIIPRLTEMGMPPYQYQLDAVEACKGNTCGIIKISTGGGKTAVSALMTAFFNKCTIIYVIGTDLLYQFHTFFSKVFEQPIGMVGDGICKIEDITIVSVWSVGQVLEVKEALLDDEGEEIGPKKEDYKAILKLLETAKIHIFDECHLAACDTIQGIAANINPERIYGMSASPWRDDNADLLIEAVLGKRIYEVNSSFLIDSGYLVRPHIHFLRPERMSKFDNYQTAYSTYIVKNPDRNELIVNSVEALVDDGRQTLVLFSSISHGKELFQLIKKIVPTIMLSGKDDIETRQDALKKIAAGEVKCILASRIFDLGVDCRSLSGLVLAGGGKSSVRALQRIGRVIRKDGDDKKDAIVIDFIDNTTYLKDHSEARKNVYALEKGFILYDGWDR